MQRDQGRVDPLQNEDGLKDELFLEPKIDFTKENKNKTSAKLAQPHKVKENPNQKGEPKLGTTTEEKADLRKAINSVKPNVPNTKMVKPHVNPKLLKKPPVPKSQK